MKRILVNIKEKHFFCTCLSTNRYVREMGYGTMQQITQLSNLVNIDENPKKKHYSTLRASITKRHRTDGFLRIKLLLEQLEGITRRSTQSRGILYPVQQKLKTTFNEKTYHRTF